MRHAVTACLLIVAFWIASPCVEAGLLAAIPQQPGLGPFSDDDNNGWSFIADAPIAVDGLAAYDVGADGFGGDMLVTLWDYSTQNLLASATIPASGDGTLFPTAGIPVLPLSAGQRYAVAAQRVDGAPEPWDRWADPDVLFQAPVSDARQVYSDTGFPGMPGVPETGYMTMGGNFTFSAQLEGDLLLEKIVDELGYGLPLTDWEFWVEPEDGEGFLVTIAGGGGQQLLEDLTAGVYTVSEVPKQWWDVGVTSSDPGAIYGPFSATFFLEAGGRTTVTFTNSLVPEPATLSLFALGGLGLLRRRRRKP